MISTEANGAESVVAADVDGDGDVDVLSASVYDNKIAWYENDGRRGTFGPQRVDLAPRPTAPYSVFAADVDGDGDVDVLSASVYDNKIAWYENDGRRRDLRAPAGHLAPKRRCYLGLRGGRGRGRGRGRALRVDQ